MAGAIVEISAGWKITVAIMALLFNGSIICLLLWKGKPDNSLHTSALSWSYATGIGILAGLGFGALAPLLANTVVKF